jgi:hypothetical protein
LLEKPFKLIPKFLPHVFLLVEDVHHLQQAGCIYVVSNILVLIEKDVSCYFIQQLLQIRHLGSRCDFQCTHFIQILKLVVYSVESVPDEVFNEPNFSAQ